MVNDPQKLPSPLELRSNAIVSFNMSDNVEFSPTNDYLLVEVRGFAKLYHIRKVIERFMDEFPRPIAVRGYGGRGVSSAVAIIHLMKTDKSCKGFAIGYFDTFTSQSADGKKLTSCQIVLFPNLESPEAEE
jgi:hypothetical protein